MLKRKGVVAIVVLLVLFAVLHLGFPPEQHTPRTTGTTMLGGLAFLMMTCSILLSTRLAIFEDWFGGLDRMYQVHRVAGVMAALTALVHFFFVPKDLPAGVDPAANALVPSAPLGMLALIALVIGLFVALNRKISYKRWRPTHKIMALVYVLAIGHFMTAPAIFFERFSTSGVLLIAAAVVGLGAMLYSIFGMNRRTALPFEVEAVNAMERATEVVLKPLGPMLDFQPGQFAFVEIEGKGWDEPHPFTISSAPQEDRLRFTMKVLGDWTRQVREELTPGRKVSVRGAYGRFDASAAGKKQVWVAGGIGVTPFLSKIRAMPVGDGREVHLVYATRSADEALFLDELQGHAARLGRLKVIPLFSDEGQFARVEVMEQKLETPLSDYAFFLCGPKAMLDGLIKDLKAHGVPREAIQTEAFEFR